MILAVGSQANTEGLGLEGTGVVLEKGHVVTDPWGATGAPGVNGAPRWKRCASPQCDPHCERLVRLLSWIP